MPQESDLHINRALTNLSIQYKNDMYLADEICPIVPVQKRSDAYFEYTKEDQFRIVDTSVSPKAEPNQVDWSVEKKNYSVEDHALADYISKESIDNADMPLNVQMDTNDFLNNLLGIDREKRVADLYQDHTNYPASNRATLMGNAKWGGTGDSPIDDVQTAVETCFNRANTLVFGHDAWLAFRKLPEILDAVKSSTRLQSHGGGLATRMEVAELFEVERVLVGRARYKTTKPGQAASYARIWGKNMLALHITEGTGIQTVSFAKSFQEQAKMTQTMFDVKRGAKGAQYIKVSYNCVELIIAADLGYILYGVIA